MDDWLPLLKTRIPGPRSRALARQLHLHESRNITYVSRNWPIFWQRAAGANVWDVDGNRYLDLTAGFGVASVGHNNPRVVAAVQAQAKQLMHAMGDVHPNELKVRLARELVSVTFGRWCRRVSARRGPTSPARVIFANSGAEAVEAALKTAAIHTNRPGVIAFEGAYHGLTYGALDATWRADFRRPFSKQLGHFTAHVPFGCLPEVTRIDDYGAVIVEPIQGRGGIVVPPDDFLPSLRKFCDRHRLVLIFDEVYSGFCRTGRWFACEHWGVVPDLVCVGKGMTGGFPIAACIGRAQVMDSWPKSDGEAIHTSTFLGNPLGCAASLAAVAEMKRLRLADRANVLGRHFSHAAARLGTIRGKGLMLGLEIRDASHACERLLRRGIIAIPEGPQSEVLGITPPLVITKRQLDYCLAGVAKVLSTR
ncbi:MAG TPA: aspartate aminotransferase family protein [Verrucomicrobiae bacterium]|nr:aspartate aminotransferase family protein [Verrucomicrobiae bacterium]